MFKPARKAIMQLSSAVPASNGPQRKALWIPAIFVLSFVVIIAVNAVMVVFAVRTFSGLETNKAYDQGLDYNTTLAEAANNAKLGWHADIAISATGSDARTILVTITDRTGTPLPDLNVKAIFVRPTNAGLDEAIPLTALNQGKYQATFKPSALGNWDLRLSAQRADTKWQFNQRIVLR
ncbi:MAG TPA: FixH family protein [Terriglobia bacterium]|nr:FixH family protein [Terriglobia bacterium]